MLKSLNTMITIGENGTFEPNKKTKNEAETYLSNIQKDLDGIIDDVFASVKSAFTKSISNEKQVKSNIKDCFDYYFKVASISFFWS